MESNSDTCFVNTKIVRAEINVVSISPADLFRLAAILGREWPEWRDHIRVQTFTAQRVLTHDMLTMIDRAAIGAVKDTTLGILRSSLARKAIEGMEPTIEWSDITHLGQTPWRRASDKMWEVP